jgi:hypothetical protein
LKLETDRQTDIDRSMAVFSQSMRDCMEDVEAVRASYESKSPFPHVVLHAICKPEVLRGAREEIIANFQATYKETDLFKMLQSMVRRLVRDGAATMATQ